MHICRARGVGGSWPGQASAVSSSAACLYDAAMGDAYGNRLTQYEHSVDFPPRSMEDDSEVSPCQLQEQRL